MRAEEASIRPNQNTYPQSALALVREEENRKKGRRGDTRARLYTPMKKRKAACGVVPFAVDCIKLKSAGDFLQFLDDYILML